MVNTKMSTEEKELRQENFRLRRERLSTQMRADKLQEKLAVLNDDLKTLRDSNEKLTAERDALKDVLRDFRYYDYAGAKADANHYEAEAKRLQEELNQVKTERDRYMTALADIRDDAEEALEGTESKKKAAPSHSPWIKWPGGEMPVPSGTKVDVRLREDDSRDDFLFNDSADYADELEWHHEGRDFDIIAFRIVET